MSDIVSRKREFSPWEISISNRTSIYRFKFKKFVLRRVNDKRAKGWIVVLFGIRFYYRCYRTVHGYRLWKENEKTKIKSVQTS